MSRINLDPIQSPAPFVVRVERVVTAQPAAVTSVNLGEGVKQILLP